MVSVFCRRLAWIAGLAALVFALEARAQLEVTVSSGVERPTPIAIVPFGWQGQGGAPPFDVSGLVEQDLANSGYFDPLEQRDMISRPTRSAQINFQDWRIVDVDLLLIGEVAQTSTDQYTIEFQLFDVPRGEQLLGFRVASSRDDLRSTAHRIADMVYEQVTGVRGIFSTRIAYISEQRNGDNRVYRLIVADADGANAAVIAESDQPLMSPSWSPDGRRIAYVSFEDRDHSVIYVQTLRTGTRERVSSRPGNNQSPVFSPDGRRLAMVLYQPDPEIYMLDLTNQVLTRITDNPAIDTEPEWSQDGKSIYFTSGRAGSAQIYRVEARPGARAQRVTFEGTYNARARISPDGKTIALIHRNQGQDRVSAFYPDTGVLNVLTSGSLDESPSVAPNGAMIIYATQDKGRGVLAAVSTDGRVHQEIASVGEDVREPVWSPYPLP